ncbi:MAG: hypothetical protein IM323_16245 [Microcystis sp. M049S1]|uniref:hypothetical protein n=1 Tax=Microcystis sp. M049S1 TaxID=2771120 RepID=UPI002587D645|nr:hypothetical protein [Microcystis sp. M049S1]MCA2864906.1 hypothetical protein [Microcystis sp. M049S1]MCA3173502.1 hypothetical protein [Burkholderiales bacterium]
MARNGSGTYNLLTNSWNPATNGVSATAVDWQNLINDVAAALTQSLSADGQTPMTGNLNAGNNKITGLAAGSATGDSLRWEQLFSQGQPVTLASAATTDIGAQNTVLLNITGTTTITSFGTNYNGPRYVIFDGVLTLTHNATTLILPGGANITTAAGDSAIVVPNGTPANGWRVLGYQKADGTTIATSKIQPKIINGAMAIDQRNSGASQTFTAGAALAYCIDRFYGYCTGANVTGQQVAGTAPNQFNYRFTGAASVTKIGFAQRIEAANSQDLAGATATLSVDLANSLLTTVTWTAWRANSTDTFGTLASPTRTQIGTGTFTVTGTLTRYSAQISVPAAATTGIEVELSVGAQTSGTWTIGRLKLEPGAFATAYDYTPIGVELALCQRYYATIPAGAIAASAYLLSAAGNELYWTSQTPVPMRVSPTIDATTLTYSALNCSANPSFSAANNSGIFASVLSVGTGNTKFSGISGTLRLSAEL